MTPEELRKQYNDDRIKSSLFHAKWGAFIDSLKIGSGFFFGITLGLAAYYVIGRLFNVCEIVRWIFCKSC